MTKEAFDNRPSEEERARRRHLAAIFEMQKMELHEFEGATKLRLHADRLQADNARLLTLLRDLYRDANPTILDDADTGVRLSPVWNERIKAEIEETEPQ